MANKLDKEELKQPDAFVATSSRVLAWIERNRSGIGAVIALAVVGSAGYFGFNYYQGRVEQSAFNALYAPEAALRKAQDAVRGERAKAESTPAGGEDFAKTYGPAVADLKRAIAGHASTRAALVSAMSLAGFLIEQKQFAEALSVLEIPKAGLAKTDFLFAIWTLQRGLALLENGKADEALAQYAQVLGAPKLRSFHAEALLKSGMAHEQKSDVPAARAAYERLSREFPQTEASATAQQFLRVLDMNQPRQG